MNKKYRKDISWAEFERIERFLLGRMDEDELKQFETDLERDEHLRDEVTLQAKLLATVESGSMNQNASILTAKMQEGGKSLLDPEATRGKRPVSRYRWHAVAAALVAVVVSVWYFGLRPSPEEQLFEAYFVPPKGLITPMSATDNYLFYDAMVDYKQGDYPQAITKWSDLLELQPKNDTLVFFIGAAYLAHGDAVRSLLTWSSPRRSPKASLMTRLGSTWGWHGSSRVTPNRLKPRWKKAGWNEARPCCIV